MKDKYYFNVPFKHKDEIKNIGGKWDSFAKQWYLEDIDKANQFLKEHPTYAPAYHSGVSFKTFEWDFGKEYEEVLKYMHETAENIIRDDYIENQEIEEAEFLDGTVTKRKYDKPFDPQNFKKEIDALTYSLMCKAAEIPKSPIVVFKDEFVDTSKLDKDELAEMLTQRYGFKIKEIDGVQPAQTEDIFEQEYFDGLKAILNKQFYERLMKLHINTGYSCKNCSMILLRNPEATFTRGKTFMEALEGYSGVQKTQEPYKRAFAIYAPHTTSVDIQDGEEEAKKLVDKILTDRYGKYISDERKQEKQAEYDEICELLDKQGRAEVVDSFSLVNVYDIKDVYGVTFDQLPDLIAEKASEKAGEKSYDTKFKNKLQAQLNKDSEPVSPFKQSAKDRLLQQFEIQGQDYSEKTDLVIKVLDGKGYERQLQAFPFGKGENNSEDAVLEDVIIQYCYETLSLAPQTIVGVKTFDVSAGNTLELETLTAASIICEKLGMPRLTEYTTKRMWDLLGENTSLERCKAAPERTAEIMLSGKGRMESFSCAFDKGVALAKDFVKCYQKEHLALREQRMNVKAVNKDNIER